MDSGDARDILNTLPAYRGYKIGKGALKNMIKLIVKGQGPTASAAQYTPAGIAAKVGKATYKTAERLQSLLAAAADYGIKKAKGQEASFAEIRKKKPTFFDVAENIPTEYSIADIARSIPGVTGKFTPTPEQAVALQEKLKRINAKTGVGYALPSIARSVLEGGQKDIPIGQIKKATSLIGRQAALASPVLGMGARLAAGTGIKAKIDTGQKASMMDLMRPALGLGLDVATHPITAIAGGGAQAIKGIQKVAGKTVGKETFEAFGEAYPRVAQMFNELFRGKDPEKLYNLLRSPSKLLSPTVKEALTKSSRDIESFGELAKQRVKGWADINDEAARTAVGIAIKNNRYGILAPLKKKYPQIEKVAHDMRRLINKAGLQAVKAGLVKEETYLKNKDTYVRRMFEYFENPENFALAKNPEANLARVMTESPIRGEGLPRVKGKLFKAREADEATRERLGELGPQHIGFTSGEGSIRTYRSARTAEMFKEIRADGSAVRPNLPAEILSGYPGADLAAKEAAAIKQAKKVKVNIFQDVPVVEIAGKQWAKMPANKAFGAIAAKWLPRFDAEHIIGTYALKPQWLQSYDTLLNAWKAGKVVLSTAAQARNVGSNIMLMVYSGIPTDRAISHMVKSAKIYASKGERDVVVRAFKRFGGTKSGWADTEATMAGSKFIGRKTPSRAGQELKDILHVPSKTYSSTEEVFKTAIMRYWHEEKGLPLKQAFEKAQETLFDYGDASKFIGGVKRTAIPFITFASKALPFTAKSALSRPMSVLPMIAVRDSLNDHMASKLGLKEKDRALVKERYGDWYLIVGGTKDKPNIVDLSYIIPGLSDMTGSGGSRGILGESPIPQSLQPSTPALTALEVLPGVNKSFYFDQPIWKDTDTGKEIAAKIASYLTKSLAPANILMPGSYQNNQLTAALKGVPAYTSGSVPSVESAIASSVGLKTSPLDLRTIEKIKMHKNENLMKELRGELFKITNSKLSPEKKKLMRKLIYIKMRKRIKEFRK